MNHPSDLNRYLVHARLMMSAKVTSSTVTPVASTSVYTLSITGVKIRVIAEADRLSDRIGAKCGLCSLGDPPDLGLSFFLCLSLLELILANCGQYLSTWSSQHPDRR
jgi:hypothetical protein